MSNKPRERTWYTGRQGRSTRKSVEIPYIYVPVNVTLATPGTAEDCYTITPVKSTVNICTNPSMETGSPPTGYTASGSTLTRDGTYYDYGSYSLGINPDNAAAGEGAYWDAGILPRGQPIAVSCYFRDAAALGDDARVRIYGNTSAGWLATGNTITLSASWQRSTCVYRGTPNSSEETYVYLVNVTQHNTTFYADGLQIELLPYVTDYCDGAQGRNYAWDGTAHASVSYRSPALIEIRGYSFITNRAIYFDTDATATSSSEPLSAGDMFWEDKISALSNLSFLNQLSGEAPTVRGRVWGIAWSETPDARGAE